MGRRSRLNGLLRRMWCLVRRKRRVRSRDARVVRWRNARHTRVVCRHRRNRRRRCSCGHRSTRHRVIGRLCWRSRVLHGGGRVRLIPRDLALAGKGGISSTVRILLLLLLIRHGRRSTRDGRLRLRRIVASIHPIRRAILRNLHRRTRVLWLRLCLTVERSLRGRYTAYRIPIRSRLRRHRATAAHRRIRHAGGRRRRRHADADVPRPRLKVADRVHGSRRVAKLAGARSVGSRPGRIVRELLLPVPHRPLVLVSLPLRNKPTTLHTLMIVVVVAPVNTGLLEVLPAPLAWTGPPLAASAAAAFPVLSLPVRELVILLLRVVWDITGGRRSAFVAEELDDTFLDGARDDSKLCVVPIAILSRDGVLPHLLRCRRRTEFDDHRGSTRYTSLSDPHT